MRAALLLLSGMLALSGCVAVRGHVTLFNETGAALEATIQRHDPLTVADGAHVRSEIEYRRVSFVVRQDGESFIYRIPFDIWETRHTDGRRRDLRLQIAYGMRVYLVPPDQESPVETPPDQPTCFPLVPMGEWLQSDMRDHSVEPSRRSRYMYGAIPRPLGPPIGGDTVVLPGPLIKVFIKDTDTGRTGRALVGNYHLASYLWWLSQGNVGWAKFTPPPEDFIRDHYVPFMQEHEDKPIEVKLRAFADFALHWRGICRDDDPTDLFPDEPPYTASELGFANRDELMDTLFKFKLHGHPGLCTDPDATRRKDEFRSLDDRFISLLIDLGFVVEPAVGGALCVQLFE